MINTIEEALFQYSQNIGGADSLTKLYKIREAIYYLIANKGKVLQHGSQKIDFDSLYDVLKMIENKIKLAEKAANGPSFFKGRPIY